MQKQVISTSLNDRFYFSILSVTSPVFLFSSGQSVRVSETADLHLEMREFHAEAGPSLRHRAERRREAEHLRHRCRAVDDVA